MNPSPLSLVETDDTIAAWADATFGPIDSPASGILRAMEEAVELRQAIRRGLPAEAVALEIADVAICLVRPMQAMQIDPPLRIAEDLGTVAAVCHDDDPRHLSRCLFLGLTEAEDCLARDGIGTAADAADEITGVVHHLHALALLYCPGGLSAAVAAKMAINRRREWRLDRTGHGSHVKAPGCPGEDATAEQLAQLDRLAEADSPAPADTGLPPGEAEFAAWFRKNYPGPDTVIHDPDWHAPRIYRAALAADRDKGAGHA